MFDVGPGVLAKMGELGDTAIHDSIFIHKNNKRVINEWGFGEYYDYEASNASGEWIILATLRIKESSIVSAIDVSNFQSRDLNHYVEMFNPAHIIVRLWHDIEIVSGRPHGLAQIQSAFDLGRTLGGYGWLYRSTSGRDWVYQCLTMLHETHAEIPVFWIDVEPYQNNLPTLDDIASAVEACVYYEVQPGIYTGKWVWDRLGNPHDFSHLPLFHAEYDIEPSLILRNPYGGWTECVGHQYTSTPIDRSIFNSRYTIKA